MSREDADELARIGVLHDHEEEGRATSPRTTSWLIELWGELRAAGFTKALGFVPEDVTLFAQALESIFAKEREMLQERLAHLPPAEVARMVESAVPLLNQFFARYHESLVRKFFASIRA